MTRVPHLSSRLQGFGTTIFAQMSALALETGALNLGQGFPDTDGPSEVADAAVEASDAALASANEMLDAAVAQCNGQDSESSGQEGSFWWMDRQFEDAKKCVRLVVFVACCHRQRRRVSSSALASLPTLSDVVSVVVRNRGVDASQGALHHRLRRSPLPPPPLLGIVR